MSTPAEKRPKKPWRGIAIAVVLLGAAGVGYLHFRNRLGLISGKSAGIRIIPRERFGEQPIIDTKLPVIGKVTFPEKGDLPKEYVDAPGVSGLLLIDYVAKNVDYSQARATWDLGDGPCQLISDGDELSMYYGSELVVRCPYLFGSSPQRATMKLGEVECELKLPTMGQPEPPIAPVTGDADPWKFKIQPKRWWSPSFKLRCEFTLEGKDTEGIRFVEIWGAPDIHAAFQIHEGESKEFAIENWTPTQSFMVRITAVEEEKLKLKLIRTDTRYDLAYADGELAYKYAGNTWSPRHVAMRIDNMVIHGEEFLGTTSNSSMYGYKNGRVIDAVGYKPVRNGGADISMTLPDLLSYPRTTQRGGSMNFQNGR